MKFVYDGVSRVGVGGIAAVAHTWRFGHVGRAMIVFAPACGAKGTAVFTAFWGSESSDEILREWLAGARLPRDDAPVCRWLASD
jgi:hypothetical protein